MIVGYPNQFYIGYPGQYNVGYQELNNYIQ